MINSSFAPRLFNRNRRGNRQRHSLVPTSVGLGSSSQIIPGGFPEFDFEDQAGKRVRRQRLSERQQKEFQNLYRGSRIPAEYWEGYYLNGLAADRAEDDEARAESDLVLARHRGEPKSIKDAEARLSGIRAGTARQSANFSSPAYYRTEQPTRPQRFQKRDDQNSPTDKEIQEALKQVLVRAYTPLTSWHFEDRSARNVNLPNYEHVTSEDRNWRKAPQHESIFHDNAEGSPELKYVHPDGREVIYDGDTKQIITDPRFAGTYNYVVPSPFPNDLGDVSGGLKYISTRIGHGLVDVLPYFFGGTVRGPN